MPEAEAVSVFTGTRPAQRCTDRSPLVRLPDGSGVPAAVACTGEQLLLDWSLPCGSRPFARHSITSGPGTANGSRTRTPAWRHQAPCLTRRAHDSTTRAYGGLNRRGAPDRAAERAGAVGTASRPGLSGESTRAGRRRRSRRTPLAPARAAAVAEVHCVRGWTLTQRPDGTGSPTMAEPLLSARFPGDPGAVVGSAVALLLTPRRRGHRPASLPFPSPTAPASPPTSVVASTP